MLLFQISCIDFGYGDTRPHPKCMRPYACWARVAAASFADRSIKPALGLRSPGFAVAFVVRLLVKAFVWKVLPAGLGAGHRSVVGLAPLFTLSRACCHSTCAASSIACSRSVSVGSCEITDVAYMAALSVALALAQVAIGGDLDPLHEVASGEDVRHHRCFRMDSINSSIRITPLPFESMWLKATATSSDGKLILNATTTACSNSSRDSWPSPSVSKRKNTSIG